jgi:hypothetical protein
MEYLWSTRQKNLFDPLRAWAKVELGTYHTWGDQVFYPFSGADWPTIDALYPKGSKYVFFGLEQEGDPHAVRLLEPREIAQNLWGPYAAMADLLRLSFFKTKEMQQFLAKGKVRGLLPVFLAFFARTGHVIYSVEHIYLTPQGTIDTLSNSRSKPGQSPWDTLVTGLRFRVGKPQEPPQEVVYISFNAANDGLRRQSGVTLFLQTVRPCVTFIKSASYLLFGAEFSQIRRLLLEQSVALLQEDSGIPYRFFDSTAWHTQLYGVYRGPIQLFRNKFQQDLYQAYRTQPVKPIAFGIGYHSVPGTSNLFWAYRRDPQKALPITPDSLTVRAPGTQRTDGTPTAPIPDNLPLQTPEKKPADTTAAPSGDSE